MATATQLNWYGKYLSVVAELTVLRNQLDHMQAQRDALLTFTEEQARALAAIQKWKKDMPEACAVPSPHGKGAQAEFEKIIGELR